MVSFSAARAEVPSSQGEQTLYNGIRLPKVWPPRDLDSASRESPKLPYLEKRPDTVPIDIGRQLFVDDFLIETTNLRRVFHQPSKYDGNPILKPETELEKNKGYSPTAVPFSDGVFFDPADNLFKMWYMAGWFDGVALATSKDGLHWMRPNYDVVPGTNQVVAPREDFRRDGVSVWLDHETQKPGERFKMFLYARRGNIGQHLAGGEGYLLTSPDGVHWTWQGKTGRTDDNTTFFYNPFRKTWVFSHRIWSRDAERRRVRGYWESLDFLTALAGWTNYDPIYWVGADEKDLPYPEIGDPTQLYKVDATPYESLMIGLMEVHYGPSNHVSASRGVPKLTQLQIAFSRDGFHWDRSNRETFIAASMRKDSWERAYLTSVGGVCLIVGDKLYFYYGAFQGDEKKAASMKGNNEEVSRQEMWSGMYSNAATGLAIMRRDGFASMDAEADGGTLTTRPITFKGRNLFVNVDCSQGALRAEVVDVNGDVIAPFTLDQSIPLSVDSTIAQLKWKSDTDLSSLMGKPVRLRFRLAHGRLYSFWVSPDKTGASHGYVAAGGPGFKTDVDNVGTSGYPTDEKNYSTGEMGMK